MPDYTEAHEVTAVFDIAGFTSIPTAIAPMDLIDVLRRYLATVFQLVESSGGVARHMNGNAVVGFWPADAVSPSKEAIGHALANAVARVSILELPRGVYCVPAIGVASGCVLHASLAVAGREIPVSIGPSVNLASRLSSGCTMMKRRILFPRELPVVWPASVSVEDVGPIVVKGMADQLQLASLKDETG